MKQRVLVTGHEGYIGSVMARVLKGHGYDVVGLDTIYYGKECAFEAPIAEVPAIKKDLRDLSAADIQGFDAVVHLAALCNDPLGNLRSNWTMEINHEASVKLARLAKDAGVQRFLLSSSCSMHGTSTAAKVTEESPVSPITPYGLSKIQAETDISKMADDRFSPTYLRNGTVYGISPRLRLDIVLNNLVGWAATTGEVRILSDGSPWRPVIHVEDVCDAFRTVLEAPKELIHNQVFHVGANAHNFRIRDLAELVRSVVPSCQVEYISESSADQRTYVADFSKIERVLHFKPRWSPAEGAQQLYDAFQRFGLTKEDMNGSRYVRLNRIRRLIDAGKLDETLRWRSITQ